MSGTEDVLKIDDKGQLDCKQQHYHVGNAKQQRTRWTPGIEGGELFVHKDGERSTAT